jgi:hypothetical protein
MPESTNEAGAANGDNHIASTNAAESTTKRRGRPPKPKNAATEPTAEPTTAPTKRGRGRPRKADATKAPVSRKRNRSPQDEAQNHGSHKRRRVSKSRKPSSDLDSIDASGSEEDDEEEEEDPEAPQTAKTMAARILNASPLTTTRTALPNGDPQNLSNARLQYLISYSSPASPPSRPGIWILPDNSSSKPRHGRTRRV